MAKLEAETFDFLKDLAANNHKDWMDNNRRRYQEQRERLIELAKLLQDSFATVDVMPFSEPRKMVARINNNRKFQPDKPPYKHNFGIMLNRGENKAGCFLNIEPGASFYGAGMYHPSKTQLDAVRNLIDLEGNRLEQIVNAPQFKKTFGEIQGERLKTSPRDFEADHPHIEFLRLKDFTVMQSFSDKEMLQSNLVDNLTQAFAISLPFLHFLDDGRAQV